ncbi:MAG: DegV family protein [Lachnospiraceae bacterium]|nr:DegV family protein [Lachnospiraceae bacterium]
MGSKVRIAADSTCDLTEDLLKQYDICRIPLCIIMGEESFYDGEEVTPDQIYAWAEANRTTPKTAAVNPEKTLEILRPFMEAGEEIVFFGISSEMSTTCNVVRLIREEEQYPGLHVVDSRNLSTGIGLQVLRAAEMAAAGCSAEEIVGAIEADRKKVCASFVVDTLTYLARGGRCGSATALLANTLKLHPLIAVKDGVMQVEKKYRGGLGTALRRYREDLKEALLSADRRRVFITHSGCDEELIRQTYEELKALEHFEEILITRAGGVVSSHCGPGTLGILFYTADEDYDKGGRTC